MQSQHQAKPDPAFNSREKKFKRHHHQAKGRVIQLASHGHGVAVRASACEPHPAGSDQPRLPFPQTTTTAAHRGRLPGAGARSIISSRRRREEHRFCHDECAATAGGRGRGAEWPIAGGEETRSTSRAPRSAKGRQRWAP
jgi:hypothetical protein